MANCDRCGRPSVYHSTLIVNGVSQTTNLCRDCAMKEGVFSQETNLFDDFMSPLMDFLPFKEMQNIVCPVCKTSLQEYKNTMKLGCPTCYEVFRDEINNILKRIAPMQNHKPEQIQPVAKDKKATTKQDKIAELRQEMAKAVSEERYEDAGKLKKKIQKLESENE